MRQWCLIGVAGLLSSGCILSTEQCGLGFIEEDGRCVLEESPPPYYSDAVPEFELRDAGLFDVPRILEPEPSPPPEPEPGFDPWADRPLILVVDRSDQADARNSPTSPGFDLDAVLVIDEQSELVGLAVAWESAQINDPFGRNLSRDPEAAIGEPDASGPDEPGRYVSLGADGGYVFMRLDLFEPIRTGHQLLVFEMDRDRGDESAELYLCVEGPLDLGRCRSAGQVRGNSTLVLD